MLNWLKNKFQKKERQALSLNANYKHNILNHISFEEIKRSIEREDFKELLRIYSFLLSCDSQIASEINKRKISLLSLPLICESTCAQQDIFLKEIVNHSLFRRFLYASAEAIAFGFSAFILEYENKEGKIYPKTTPISYRYFDFDKNGLYIFSDAKKYYCEQRDDIFLYYHPANCNDFIQSSLMYQVMIIASLKNLVISKNMIYFDNLSVPPLIIQSQAVANEEQAKAIVEQALDLRANGIALFAKDDLVSLLNNTANQANFLDFIRYCDESISKLITGQVLAGNSVGNGTQALGNVHNNIRKDILSFDSLLLAESVSIFLREILKLNFKEVAPFKFEFDTNSEEDEKNQSEVYLNLHSMGIEIPLEHLEKTFKIKGLKRQLSSLQEPHLTLSQNKAMLPIALEKPSKIPVSKELQSLLSECESFDSVYEKILNSYTGKEVTALEEELMQYLTNAQIKGALNEDLKC